jgi:hypothetical protein
MQKLSCLLFCIIERSICLETILLIKVTHYTNFLTLYIYQTWLTDLVRRASKQQISKMYQYIIHKILSFYSRDVIPIVMGPSKKDYERVAPPNSFVHVKDFPGPKELAQYLIQLDKNDNEYNKYFAWKGSGSFIDTKFWCRLCAIANNPKPKVYQNIDSWWRGPGTCEGENKNLNDE